MLIWSGWGILVPIILILMGLLGESIAAALNVGKFNWPMALAWILSGVIIWFLGKKLNNPAEKVLIDKETGEEVILNTANHRLFFIKMEYWGPIIWILTLLIVFDI